MSEPGSQVLVEEQSDLPKFQTSPLTDIPTSPPNPTDLNLDHSPAETFKTADSNSTKRNNSVDSYISSELSELDSEAETEKMDFVDFNKSELSILANEDDEEEPMDDDEEERGHVEEGAEYNEGVVEEDTILEEINPEDEVKTQNEEEEDELEEEMEDPETNGEGSLKSEESKEIDATMDVTLQNGEEDQDGKSTKETSIEPDEKLPEASENKSSRNFMNGKVKTHIEDELDDEEEDEDSSDLSSSADSKKRKKTATKKELAKKRKFQESEVESTIEEHDEHQEETGDAIDAESPHKSVEDTEVNESRMKAIEELIQIEGEFAKLRDKIYEDKLNQLECELKLCVSGAHPKLSKICIEIEEEYNQKMKHAKFNLDYQLECIDKQTKSQRTQLHQQFIKDKIDLKNGLIDQTTERWYKINKERSLLDNLVPEFNFKVSNDKYDLIIQRNNLHMEVSSLAGLNKYYGFPTPPEIKAARKEEIDEDLIAMGLL